MKFIFTLFLLTLLSCNTAKKEYVCGDHTCVNKKEFNEFFSKNLTIEIKSQNNKNNKIVDLAKLNTNAKNIEINNNKNAKKENKIKKKKDKNKIKEEKIRVLEELKTREDEKKKNAQLTKIAKLKAIAEEQAQNEISNNREVKSKIVNNASENKQPIVKITEKTISEDTLEIKNTKSICDEIKDCDIDKITELLTEKGKDKPFPNMSSN